MNILQTLLSWCYSVLSNFFLCSKLVPTSYYGYLFSLLLVYSSPVTQKSCHFCLCRIWASFYILPRQLKFLEFYSYYASSTCEIAVGGSVLPDTTLPSTAGLFFRFEYCSNCFKVFLNLKEANYWLGKGKTTYTCKHFFRQSDHLLNCPRNWC